ncbi:unnamed protein product [Tenebrio molitor]|nr:unnamed protein product [Tenebrio molitor]
MYPAIPYFGSVWFAAIGKLFVSLIKSLFSWAAVSLFECPFTISR